MLLTLIENLSHVVAFSLAMHNSNANLFLHDLRAGFPQPDKRSLREVWNDRNNR
jgi:hypothetical protein